MILYVVRHGLTEWNRVHRYQGQTDVSLCEEGREQAARLAARLAAIPLARCYTSDLKRARQTAERLIEGRDVPLVADAAFREIALGELEGLLREEAMATHASWLQAWQRTPGEVTAPGGESLREVQERVWSGVQGIAAAHPGPEERVLLVAHGFAIITLVCRVLGVPLNHFRRFWMDSTGITELNVRGDRWIVRRMNDTAHLE